MQQRRRSLRIISRVLLALTVVYGLGIASSLVSRAACARKSRADTLAFLAGAKDGREAIWLEPTDLVDQFDALQVSRKDMVGSYRVMSRLLPLRMLMPRRSPAGAWAYAQAQITPWPFIVRVDYGRLATFSYGVCGSVGTELYFAIFGTVVRLGQWPVIMW